MAILLIKEQGQYNWGSTVTEDYEKDVVNNRHFPLITVITGLEIKNNPILDELVQFVKQDIKNGVKAHKYYRHAKLKQWMAIDKSREWNAEIERMLDGQSEIGFTTERVIYKNITIGDFKFKELRMWAITGDELHYDETPFHFKRFYYCPANVYFDYEL